MARQWEFFDQVTQRETLIQRYCPFKTTRTDYSPAGLFVAPKALSHRCFNRGLNIGLRCKEAEQMISEVFVCVAVAPC